MPYTPPSSASIVVELSTAQAYTPPSASSIVVDLALEDGEVSGDVSFIRDSGALVLDAYPPAKGIVVHTLPVVEVGLVAYPPTHAITRTSIVSVTGALSLVASSPSYSATNSVGVSSLTLDTHSPTYFRGMTQNIVEQGALSFASDSSITTTKNHVSNIACGSLALSVSGITASAVTYLDTAALALQGNPIASHKYRVWSGVDSRYHSPDITMDEAGAIIAQGHAPTQKQRIYRGIDSYCGLMRRVTTAVIGAYTARVSSSSDSLYTISAIVAFPVVGEYSISNTDRIVAAFDAPYRAPVTQAVDSSYSVFASLAVRASVSSGYSLIATHTVRSAVDALYSSLTNVRVSAAFDSAYSYYSTLRKGIVSDYSMTIPVVKAVDIPYTLEAIAKIRRAIDAIYSAPQAQVISIIDAPYVEYQGRRLGVAEAEITIAEGDYAWTCTVVLSETTDYAQLRQNQAFAVVIGPERYEFIVDSKELDRSNPANYGMKLMGISPSARFASPRMLSSSSAWDTITSASAIATELLPGVDWQVLDWNIPAYRFAIQDTTSVEAVRTLASAIGATLETDLDGTPYVRSLYPVSVPNYATATPDHIFTEATDIITVNESYVSSEVFNRLVITDIEQEISDTLEWIEDYSGATTGVMRAFLYPWRSAVSLLHTGTVNVVIDTPNTVLTQHEEIIEVFQGQGDTSYPIHHIDSITYEAQNVGGIIFDMDSRSFTVGGPSFNSVIQLVYWTRSLDYRVSLPDARPTQFLLESDPL